jgi:hypothetical protein
MMEHTSAGMIASPVIFVRSENNFDGREIMATCLKKESDVRFMLHREARGRPDGCISSAEFNLIVIT